MLGATEIIIIAILAGILLFGGKKISDVAKSLGRFTTEFKKGKMEAEEELKDLRKEVGEIADEVKEEKKESKNDKNNNK